MNNYLKALIICLLMLGVGYYYGIQNPKIVTKVEEKEIIKKDIVTVVKEVVKKDGSKKTVTTITDKSKEKKETQISQKIILPSFKNNRVGVHASTYDFKDVHSYTFTYEKRITGPLWVGISYNTKQIYGLGLSYEF